MAKVQADVPDYENIPDADEAGIPATGEFYPDLPRNELVAMLGVPLVIHEVAFRPSQFEGDEFVLLRATNLEDGTEFTTRSGSSVLSDQLHKASFPFRAKCIQPAGKRYYKLVPVRATEA